MSALFCTAAAGSCGGGGSALPTGPSPVAASVQFEYEALPLSKGQTEQASECQGVSRIYPSWWGFTHATMIPAGPGRFAAVFENVPVGRQSVRIEAPVGCTASSLSANQTVLSPDGERGFAFTVHTDGSVTD